MTIEGMERGNKIIATIKELENCEKIFNNKSGSTRKPIIDDGHCCSNLFNLDEETYEQLKLLIINYCSQKIDQLNEEFEKL
jgi:hypothetical protein